MTITAKNSKEVYIVMIIIFAVGLTWNTYYVHKIADERTEYLELKNEEFSREVNNLNTQLDSAHIRSYRLSSKYIEMHRIIQEQTKIIERVDDRFDEQFDKHKKIKDEKSYISDTTNHEHNRFLSEFKYEPY